MRMPKCLALAGLALLPAAAHAAEPDIIVTARLDKRELTSLATPSFGVAVHEDQLQAINAVNTEDLLRYAPATIVRKRYAGDPNATLSFRNMHSQQTPRALVMVDGFIISNFLGADWDTAPKWGVIAPDDIDRVEIIYGPTSARYAGNSMGGTMLVATRPIRETAIRAELQGLGQHYHYYQTSEDLYGWSADLGLDVAIGGHGGIAIGYRHFENAGQPMEWRMAAANSPYVDQAQVDAELPFLRIGAQDSVVRSRQDQWRVRGEWSSGDWRIHGLMGLLVTQDDMTNPKSFLKDTAGQPTFVGISGINAGLTSRSELLSGIGAEGKLGDWQLHLSASRFDTLRDRDRHSDNNDPTTGIIPMGGRYTTGDASWQNLDGTLERRFGRQQLAFGLSYAHYRDDRQTMNASDWRAATLTSLRDAAGGRTRLFGLFIEDAIDLGGQVKATLGLRQENWRASGGYLWQGAERVSYASRSASAWSPKLALAYEPDGRTSLKASLALATRFPTVRELYQPGLVQYGADVGALDLNGFNPDLRPERAIDAQLTASHRFANWQLTVDFYRQDVRNTIFAQSIAIPDSDTGDLVQSSLVTNIGRLRSWGVDVLASAEDLFVHGLALDANLSWADATITRNDLNPALVGYQFPRIPHWRVNASLRYAPDPDWDLALNFRHQSTPDRNIENDATSKCGTFFCVSRFSFVDVKISHQIGAFRLSAGIDNLLDEKAFVYHPYPARSFLLALKWNGGL